MKTMHRFEVPVDDQWHRFHCPDSDIRKVEATGSKVEFWCEVSSSSDYSYRKFRVFGTGHPVPDDAFYVGTASRTSSGLVWHLYERDDAVVSIKNAQGVQYGFGNQQSNTFYN